jgi:hypothetical protein
LGTVEVQGCHHELKVLCHAFIEQLVDIYGNHQMIGRTSTILYLLVLEHRLGRYQWQLVQGQWVHEIQEGL